MMRGLSTALLVLLVTSPLSVEAQFATEMLARPLTLTVTPENPGPNAPASAHIESYALDLDRSTVTWYINGKQFAKGAGLADISFSVGAANSRTTIQVEAVDSAGVIGQAQMSVTPAEMNIIWESDAYVPPFYKGKRLAGASSNIRAQAMTQFARGGTPIEDKDIIFKWSRNGSPLASISGRGKSSVSFTGPSLFGTDTITVVAQTVDGTLTSRTSIQIESLDPFVFLYEFHPLFGILLHQPLQGPQETQESEKDFTALPFFAKVTSPRSEAITYQWSLDGTSIPNNPQSPQNFKIRTDNYSGPTSISVSLSSNTDLTLSTTGTWEMYFGSRGSGSSGSPRSTPSPFGTGQ